MKKVLNIGGGDKSVTIPAHFDGWQQDVLDIDPRVKPEICMDARELATRAVGEYDAVYCCHNLEHYYRHDAVRVIRGMRHVVKSDRFVEIVVSGMDWVMREFVSL